MLALTPHRAGSSVRLIVMLTAVTSCSLCGRGQATIELQRTVTKPVHAVSHA